MNEKIDLGKGYQAVETAAILLHGNPSHKGLLHFDLFEKLTDLDYLCAKGLEHASVGAVAAVIVAWKIAHPGEAAIGEG